MKFLNKLFHLDERKTSLKFEIIGGLITFVALCYILPVVASNLANGAGMNKQGVFVVTALLTFIITLIMGLVGNLPITLSTGLGINAYIAFTLSNAFPNWEQRMILMTISGIFSFILFLTPVRKFIINAIPKDLKLIIAGCLGAFLIFVGLKNAGVVVADGGTLVKLGNFADPGMLISVLAIFVAIGFMFSKNTILKSMAIPLGILFAAIAGLTSSLIMTSTGAMQIVNGVGIYQFGKLQGTASTLPIAPCLIDNLKFADLAPMKEVFLFGLFRDSYSGKDFASDLGVVFSNPVTYVAIFSIAFINIFDTTATYLSTNDRTGILDEEGKIINYHRTAMADSFGSLLAGPFGTTTIEPLAESNIGIAFGAKTGLAACISAFMFLLSAFIYPIFSIFTANSVTAPAIVGIGIIIMSSTISQLDLKRLDILIVAVISMILSVLTYSISNGIGFGLIAYCVINVVSGKQKEVGLPVYIITGLFVVAFIAEAIVNSLI